MPAHRALMTLYLPSLFLPPPAPTLASTTPLLGRVASATTPFRTAGRQRHRADLQRLYGRRRRRFKTASKRCRAFKPRRAKANAARALARARTPHDRLRPFRLYPSYDFRLRPFPCVCYSTGFAFSGNQSLSPNRAPVDRSQDGSIANSAYNYSVHAWTLYSLEAARPPEAACCLFYCNNLIRTNENSHVDYLGTDWCYLTLKPTIY